MSLWRVSYNAVWPVIFALTCSITLKNPTHTYLPQKTQTANKKPTKTCKLCGFHLGLMKRKIWTWELPSQQKPTGGMKMLTCELCCVVSLMLNQAGSPLSIYFFMSWILSSPRTSSQFSLKLSLALSLPACRNWEGFFMDKARRCQPASLAPNPSGSLPCWL